MSWAPHYLKFPDEATARATLRAAQLYKGQDDDRNPNLDVIGESWRNDAVLDAQGKVITPATKRDGYFVNLIWDGPIPPMLRAFEIFPVTPFRVFAGWGNN